MLRLQKGFTLIELMATLAILALIVVIAVPSVGNLIANADEKSETASIHLIENAASVAHAAGEDYDDFNRYSVMSLIRQGYLDLDPADELASSGAYVEHDAGFTYVRKAGRNLLTKAWSDNFVIPEGQGAANKYQGVYDDLVAGREYTISFDYEVLDGHTPRYFLVYPRSIDKSAYTWHSAPSHGESSGRTHVTFVPKEGEHRLSVYSGENNKDGHLNNVAFSNMMLIEGRGPTEWDPTLND